MNITLTTAAWKVLEFGVEKLASSVLESRSEFNDIAARLERIEQNIELQMVRALRAGIEYLLIPDLMKARDQLIQAASDPYNALGMLLLAAIYKTQDRDDLAFRHAIRALRLNPFLGEAVFGAEASLWSRHAGRHAAANRHQDAVTWKWSPQRRIRDSFVKNTFEYLLGDMTPDTAALKFFGVSVNIAGVMWCDCSDHRSDIGRRYFAAIDLNTGKIIWKIEIEDMKEPVYVADDIITFYDPESELYNIVSSKTGIETTQMHRTYFETALCPRWEQLKNFSSFSKATRFFYTIHPDLKEWNSLPDKGINKTTLNFYGLEKYRFGDERYHFLKRDEKRLSSPDATFICSNTWGYQDILGRQVADRKDVMCFALIEKRVLEE